jgi:hypothetical protein
MEGPGYARERARPVWRVLHLGSAWNQSFSLMRLRLRPTGYVALHKLDTSSPALVTSSEARLEADGAPGFAGHPIPKRDKRGNLQRFPVISDHSVIQVHSVNRYDREAP